MMGKYPSQAGSPRDYGGQQSAYQNMAAPPPPPPPPQLSPLSSMIEALRRRVAALESLCEGLEHKLAPVLVTVPEALNEKTSGVRGPESAVVMELGELDYRLGQLCRNLDRLMSRIET